MILLTEEGKCLRSASLENARLREEVEMLRERCEAYKGQVWAGSQEIERLRTALLRIIAADTHLQGVTAEDAIEVEGGFAEIAREALRPIEQSPPVTGKE